MVTARVRSASTDDPRRPFNVNELVECIRRHLQFNAALPRRRALPRRLRQPTRPGGGRADLRRRGAASARRTGCRQEGGGAAELTGRGDRRAGFRQPCAEKHPARTLPRSRRCWPQAASKLTAAPDYWRRDRRPGLVIGASDVVRLSRALPSCHSTNTSSRLRLMAGSVEMSSTSAVRTNSVAAIG